MVRFSGVVLVLVLALVATPVILAQYGGGGDYGYEQTTPAGVVEQIRTARTHATYSAGSEVLRGVLEHLGHVVNCLEGPRGKNYDAKNDNPCQGQGAGVIPDLESAGRSTMTTTKALDAARDADKIAVETLKLTDLARAKTAASKVADLLSEALRAVSQ